MRPEQTILGALAVLGSLLLAAILTLLFLLAVNDVRLKVRRWIKHRLGRERRRVIEEFRVKLAPPKIAKKQSVRERLVADPILGAELEAHARSTGEPVTAILERVDDYADEIIPFFNVVSYYRVGYTLGALITRALYWPWRNKDEIARVRGFLDRAEQNGDTVVFVMNHRSNADFVLVGYVLARAIALSYAVGEWARVWPLEWLFKSFGSYFVRRGCRDPVYHMTLRRYLQMITEQGLTQGIFIEGGLSKDGALRPAKIGLLDSIAARPPPEGGAKTRDVVFLPVGINYDRVLEDEMLTKEEEGASGMGSGLRYYASAGLRVARYLFNNLPRYVVRRVRKFGYAAVRFGEPISLSSLIEVPIAELGKLDREARKPIVQKAGDRLLATIADVVPVTPVALVASALLGAGGDEEHHVSEQDLGDRMAHLIEALKQAGAPIVALEKGLAHIENVGLTILETRRHIERVGGVVATAPETRHLLRYYRNSVIRHLERANALPAQAGRDELALHTKAIEPELTDTAGRKRAF